MSSLIRKISSRTNGARSRGPVTPAKQSRSSRNAVRGGLLAKCLLLESESREDFDALLADFVERFRPADGVELCMVEEMLSAVWRQRRLRAIEARITNNPISTRPPDPHEPACLTDAFAIRAAKSNLDFIHRYEKGLHQIFQRAHANLILMRSLQELQPPEKEKITKRSHSRLPTRTKGNHLHTMTHEPNSPKDPVPVPVRPAFRPPGAFRQPAQQRRGCG